MKDFLRILHLSDIHYSKNSKEMFETLVKNPLFESLRNDNKEREIDLICLTGDLIDKGTGGFTTTEEAFSSFDNDFVQPLCEVLKIEKHNIILSPGNHDINRGLDSRIEEKGLQSILKTDEEINEFIKSNHVISQIGQGMRRIIPYKEYESGFYKGINDSEITAFESSHIRTIKGIKTGLVSLNSAWRCYDDNSEVIIGERQIISGLEKIKDCQLKILLSHYSLEKISEVERNLIMYLSDSQFQICCFGHNHSLAAYSKHTLQGNSFLVSSCRGCIPDNHKEYDINFINGYSMIDYSIKDSIVEYTPKIYSITSNKYIIDMSVLGGKNTATFKLNNDGIITFESSENNIKLGEYYKKIEGFCNHQINNYIKRKTLFKVDDKNEINSSENFLTKYKKLVLLADAGLGKSLECIYLLKKIINDNRFSKKIPILLIARQYNVQYNTINDGIKAWLSDFYIDKVKNIFDSLMSNGNFILIIDGIDEITDKTAFSAFISDINRFIGVHGNALFFITCRKNQYHDQIYGCKKTELLPLDYFEIKNYLLEKAININHFSKNYQELFENPFFLQLAVQVYGNNSRVFATIYNKSKFLEAIILQLAGLWDSKKGINKDDVNYYKLFIEIGKIIYENFNINSFSLLKFEKLFENIFTTSKAFDKLRLEIFVYGTEIEFKHKLFKEFLVAYYLYNTFGCSNDAFKLYSQIIKKEEWIEVLVFIAGLIEKLEDQDKFYDFLLENNLKIYLICLTTRNDLSQQLQSLTKEEYEKRYLSIFYKTYINIINRYFPVLKDKFDPVMGENKNTKICCFGNLSEDKRIFRYWFDRIENPMETVTIVPFEHIKDYHVQLEANGIKDKRSINTYTHNLVLSRLEGDSARFLAVKLVYRGLKYILDHRQLYESDYILCEYINVIKNSFRETYKDEALEDIKEHFLQKLEKDSRLPTGEHCIISAYNGISTEDVLSRLNYLISKAIKLNEMIFPHHDKHRCGGCFYDMYSKDCIKEYLSKFFYWEQLSLKEMIEKNFKGLEDYFKIYNDIPYQVFCVLHETINKEGYDSIFYYHIATDEISKPNFFENSKLNIDSAQQIMESSYAKKNRKLYYSRVTSSLIDIFLPVTNNYPLQNMVYEIISDEIAEIFNEFK